MIYCIVNGHFVPQEEAVISIQDRGFRYGDGVFETLAIHDGVPYQFDLHASRLADGLRSIKIEFDINNLHGYCRQLIKKNGVDTGILRIQVTRGIGSKGYLPDPSHPQAGAAFVIETSPQPAIMHEPVALWQSTYTKISSRALPLHHKLCQGLNSTLARMEAHEHHCTEALLLNENGYICETSSGNIFWLKDEKLYTPSLNCDLLKGTTRAAIIRLSPYPVMEVEAGMDELAKADAVYITNVVWQAIGVAILLPSGMHWQSEAVAGQFRRLLDEDRKNYCRMHKDEW